MTVASGGLGSRVRPLIDEIRAAHHRCSGVGVVVSELGAAKSRRRQAAYAASYGAGPLFASRSPRRTLPQARAPSSHRSRNSIASVGGCRSVMIAAAERRAREIDVGAERVLIASGATQRTRLRRRRWPRASPCRLRRCAMLPAPTARSSDDRLVTPRPRGMLPVFIGGELAMVVAPRNDAARMLSALARIGSCPIG